MYDLIKEDNTKEYVIHIPAHPEEEVDWKELEAFNENCNLTLALENILDAKHFQGIKFYWAFPINTWFDLRAMVGYGVSQLYIDMPLTFELDKIKAFDLPVRVCANECHLSLMPSKDGIKGFYIRPEDVDYYSKYIKYIEFKTDAYSKEAELLRIYQEGVWNGNLNLLLSNLNYDIDNRGIVDEFAYTRTNCRQRCMSEGTCHFCDVVFKFTREVDKITTHAQDEGETGDYYQNLAKQLRGLS